MSYPAWLTEMEIKFFPRDIIGRKPQKVGDEFKALFMDAICTFRVTHISDGCVMATRKP